MSFPRKGGFSKKRNFQRNKPVEDENEKKGNRFQRKANFFNSQKLEENGGKIGKFSKRTDQFQGRKWDRKKGAPVKHTSVEYDQLGGSDEDDNVPDVSDMLEEEQNDGNEIPMVNESTSRLSTKSWKNPPKTVELTVKNDLSDQEIVEKNDEVEESEDDEEERLKFREEISNMPLGKVREMKEKLGIKLFNKTYFGVSEQEKSKKSMKPAEKVGQHRPKEISSKRPVSTFRNIYGEHEINKKKKKWDPRFDERAGEFKEVCFENNYQFLDEIRNREIEELREKQGMTEDEKEKGKMKRVLQKMETREKTRMEKRRKMETRRELHEENIQRMLRGEAPVFKTKAQVRHIDMEKKFNELKKDNNLEKYLKRKARKESAKLKKAQPI